MANTTLKFGNGNWAIKKDSALAYSDQYDNYKPLPFDFARASNGTIVNKSGLIESVNSGLPRIDFSYSTDGGLLLEPQSTNLITYSEDFSNSYWTKSSVTLTSGFTAPDGSNNAYKVEGTIGTSYLVNLTVNQDLRSIYVRTVSGTGQIKLLGNSTLYDVNEQWTRVSYNPTSDNYQFAVDFRGGTDISEVLIWGAQVEQQSHATSYIPTSGASSTRVVDFSNGFNLNPQQEGLIPSNSPFTFFIYVNINIGTPSVGNGFYFTENNSTAVYYYGSTMMIRSATGEEYSSIPSGLHKIAISYDGSRAKLFIDGSKTEDVNASSRFANINNMNFYRNNSNSSFEFNDLRLFNEALSDEELQKLTTI